VTRLDALRIAAWLVPLAVACSAIYVRRHRPRIAAATILSFAWNAWTLLAVNLVALELGWWSFAPGPSVLGVAVEPWLGWSMWWSVVALMAHKRPVWVTVVGVAWLDVIAMPLLEPLVILREGWLIGEGIALVVALVPGFFAARWTLARTYLARRVLLQVGASVALFMWIVPSIAFDRSGGWAAVLTLPTAYLGLVGQIVAIAGAPGARAALELVQRGDGTPLPYDATTRLVTSGPYAYVRNPMQVAMVLVYLLAGILLWEEWLIAAAVVAFSYGAGLAFWHEDVALEERFGKGWADYRSKVLPWIPRFQPVIDKEATLLVAFSCGVCSSIGRWFIVRRPTGLNIAPAEESADPELRRVTYVPADGRPVRGVAAIARALEHINLGWAFVGWILAMPGVSHLAQLMSDVWGPGPQRVAGPPYDRCAVEPLAHPAIGKAER